jgi:hypothetical protein
MPSIQWVWKRPNGMPGHGDLLNDCEEDRTLRAVLIGMLREMDTRA